MNIDYVVGSSGGNDSVALIQHMLNQGKSFMVLYNDTGWAKEGWSQRISDVAAWCHKKGVLTMITQSEGMEALVRRKKGWPMPASKMQFCTQALKEKPTTEWLEQVDPDKDLTFVTGRRRLESNNRATLPQYEIDSPKHGGRECWNPLYLHTTEMRDELLAQTPFSPLPHQSMECYPCVCANKSDMAEMAGDEERIAQIEIIEISMGHTRNEKPRTMFRPYRAGGAVGVRQVVEWGCGPRGHKASHYPEAYKYKGKEKTTDQLSDIAYDDDTVQGRIFDRQCDGGYCGN